MQAEQIKIVDNRKKYRKRLQLHWQANLTDPSLLKKIMYVRLLASINND